MSWDGPDRERGPAVIDKPVCSSRPLPGSDEDAFDAESYLGGRSLPWDLAQLNGWYASRAAGDNELRIVIPCISSNLMNLYWQARRVSLSKEKYPPRYQSPHGVSRGDALVVMNPRVKEPWGTVLVEGPMDALAAAASNFRGVAWMGTTPGDAPILFARKFIVKNKPIFVVTDQDAVTSAVDIWRHFPGAFLVDPYPYKDLADVPKDERTLLFKGR